MDEIMTADEVAKLLRIHVRTLYKLAERGAIPGSKIGRGWRFSKVDIMGLVHNRPGKGTTSGNSAGHKKRGFQN